MLLTLIGYRATGKTTLARLLAERMGCDWIDADVEIERRAGKSIARIFAEDGEPVFRDLEARVIADLCRRQRLILAAGGGAPLRPESREAMRTGGKVVWLKATPTTIQARMSGDQTTANRRPNLTSQGGLEEIVQVLSRREPIYRQTAHLEVDTEEKSPGQIVEEILRSGVVCRPCEADPPFSRNFPAPSSAPFRPGGMLPSEGIASVGRKAMAWARPLSRAKTRSPTCASTSRPTAKRFSPPASRKPTFASRSSTPSSRVWAGTCAMPAMVAPQYREVIPEDSLDVEGQQKAPDYAFRVGTLPKFYAEAKKCGVNIGADPGPAFQLRRYGWSAKVALSILTDFEELGVYDCTIRPRPSDKASHARILHFRFEEYPDRWRELWDIFSREAVWSGAFDQYAASKRKRGTSEVDVEFLKEIEGWRDALARNIALRNKGLSSDDLNAAVQTTIDRVVFLRMAEDRRLEPYEQLLKLCERDDIYPRFMRDLCRKADEKYNSGLFHFQKEERRIGRPRPHHAEADGR